MVVGVAVVRMIRKGKRVRENGPRRSTEFKQETICANFSYAPVSFLCNQFLWKSREGEEEKAAPPRLLEETSIVVVSSTTQIFGWVGGSLAAQRRKRK